MDLYQLKWNASDILPKIYLMSGAGSSWNLNHFVKNPLQPVLVWNCSSQRLTKRLTDLLTHKSSSQTVLTLSLVFFWQSVWPNSSKVYYCILNRFVRHITFLLSSKPRELTFSPFLMITKPFSWKNFVNQKNIWWVELGLLQI